MGVHMHVRRANSATVGSTAAAEAPAPGSGQHNATAVAAAGHDAQFAMTPDEMKADMLATFSEKMVQLRVILAARRDFEAEFRRRSTLPPANAEHEDLRAMAERLHQQNDDCESRTAALWEEMGVDGSSVLARGVRDAR